MELSYLSDLSWLSPRLPLPPSAGLRRDVLQRTNAHACFRVLSKAEGKTAESRCHTLVQQGQSVGGWRHRSKSRGSQHFFGHKCSSLLWSGSRQRWSKPPSCSRFSTFRYDVPVVPENQVRSLGYRVGGCQDDVVLLLQEAIQEDRGVRQGRRVKVPPDRSGLSGRLILPHN